ncbi:MAG: tetratricopeptide repeat protein [Deltaproteobacteria bacterium]|nr:tetratricopeptide repeat protein [Deltaproteobacteria bacterium]
MSREHDDQHDNEQADQELARYVQKLFASQSAAQPGDELRSMRLATRTAAAVSRLQEDPLLSSTLRAFDAEALVLPDDQALAARLASAAVLGSGASPVRRRRSGSWLGMPMALSVVLISSGVLAASALVVKVVVPAFVAREPLEPTRRHPRRVSPPIVAAPVVPVVPTKPEEPPTEAPQETPAVSAPKPRAHSELGKASQLFAQANRERRNGHTSQAIALYRRLVQRHGGAAEAGLARLSLADLDAAAGRRRQALAQLNAFLASPSSSPALVQEALQRKARLLAAAHRTREARAAWNELRTRFPQSVYRAEAERFLASPASQ